jgi:hypothetical protein
MRSSKEACMATSQNHLPDRLCSVPGSTWYDPIYSELVCVYLDDVALDYVVEACRSAGWAIKYEIGDDGKLVTDHNGKLCMSSVRGKIDFYERRHKHEQCKVFLSDYPR